MKFKQFMQVPLKMFRIYIKYHPYSTVLMFVLYLSFLFLYDHLFVDDWLKQQIKLFLRN